MVLVREKTKKMLPTSGIQCGLFGEFVRVSAQSQHSAVEVFPVEVGALQMAAPGGGVKGAATVYDAAIVKARHLSGRHVSLQDKVLVVRGLEEGSERRVEGRCVFRWTVVGRH